MVTQLGSSDRSMLFLDQIPLGYLGLLEPGNPQHQCKATIHQSAELHELQIEWSCPTAIKHATTADSSLRYQSATGAALYIVLLHV